MAGCDYNWERRLFTKVIAWLATARLRGQVMENIRLTGFSLTMDKLKMIFFLKCQLNFSRKLRDGEWKLKISLEILLPLATSLQVSLMVHLVIYSSKMMSGIFFQNLKVSDLFIQPTSLVKSSLGWSRFIFISDEILWARWALYKERRMLICFSAEENMRITHQEEGYTALQLD